jgi:hypothetical protein
MLMVGSVLGHGLRRRGLSSVPGFVVAGLVAGALFGVHGADPAVAGLSLAATGYALFVLGASLTLGVGDLRAVAVVAPVSLGAMVGLCAATIPVASVLASALGLHLPSLSARGTLVLALVLATASPSIVGLICSDALHRRRVRTAIASVVSVDVCIILLVGGLDSSAAASSILPSLSDLLPAALFGAALAVLLVRSRPGPSPRTLAAAVVLLVLVVGDECPLPIAVLASSMFVGIALANVAPGAARRIFQGGEGGAAASWARGRSLELFELAVVLALGCAAATIAIREVLIWIVPALALVAARWLGTVLATRACAFILPSRLQSPLGPAALLPQAGLAIVLLDGLDDLAQPLAPYRGLVVAVVLIDALVMSGVLARRSSCLLEHGRAFALDIAADPTQEARCDVGSVGRLVLAVEDEAAQPQLGLCMGLVAHEHDPWSAARGSVGAERSGGTSEAQSVFGLHACRDREPNFAGCIADGEVEADDVFAREARMRDRDLGAVDSAQHDRSRADGDQTPLDLADPQVVPDAVAILDPEHHSMKDVAKPW